LPIPAQSLGLMFVFQFWQFVQSRSCGWPCLTYSTFSQPCPSRSCFSGKLAVRACGLAGILLDCSCSYQCVVVVPAHQSYRVLN
jgi:hypothetical protein